MRRSGVTVIVVLLDSYKMYNVYAASQKSSTVIRLSVFDVGCVTEVDCHGTVVGWHQALES